MSTARPPLRERKKQRTRAALIDTALDLFTRQGFANTTLDELCDAVEVSKRTFFRNFTSKEDVAMAPARDLWAAFLSELRVREPDGRPLAESIMDTLLAAVASMPAHGWADRLALSLNLAAVTPSMNANGLGLRDRTIRESLEILGDRLVLPDDVRPRLAMDVVVAAFDIALERWVRGSGPCVPAGLAAEAREVFAAAPGCLTLTVEPRSR
ncbi:TetR/AcrR family transcriptional regulator [Actinophytocola sp.]|uniref:TetR/AcrR family transcriptional regulator n=1 Tax=Actinophytocola sp. TaxID=1872138 RepID=UPI002D2E6834|nr:TetR/AcrR family transcriptional regulator [Actinophytocola sp.]HYQ68901.1 TetR/AcrR family transcriptional regulator [Actinophytocola sp.]